MLTQGTNVFNAHEFRQTDAFNVTLYANETSKLSSQSIYLLQNSDFNSKSILAFAMTMIED